MNEKNNWAYLEAVLIVLVFFIGGFYLGQTHVSEMPPQTLAPVCANQTNYVAECAGIQATFPTENEAALFVLRRCHYG